MCEFLKKWLIHLQNLRDNQYKFLKTKCLIVKDLGFKFFRLNWVLTMDFYRDKNQKIFFDFFNNSFKKFLLFTLKKPKQNFYIVEKIFYTKNKEKF